MTWWRWPNYGNYVSPRRLWHEGVRWQSVQVELPTVLPLAVDYVRDRVLRAVNGTVEDGHIESLIAAATEAAEHDTGRILAPQTWQMILDSFPDGEIVVDKLPVIDIVSLEYVDADGDTQELAVSPPEFHLAPSGFQSRARLTPLDGASWPGTRDQPDAVTITYTCGYEDMSRIPPIILTGMGLFIAELYQIRGLSVQGSNTSVPSQLQLDRFWKRVVD